MIRIKVRFFHRNATGPGDDLRICSEDTDEYILQQSEVNMTAQDPASRFLEPQCHDENGAGFAPLLPDISGETITALVRDIEKTGFAVLPNYVDHENLKHLQSFVSTKVAEAGGEYVELTGKPAFQGTMLDAIADAPEFMSLIRRIYQTGYGLTPPPQLLYQVLRCLKGKTGLAHSYFFHYDSYVVTVLLPIIIPTGDRAGHLVMIPNLRKLRSTYLINVFDKLLADNKLAQFLFLHAFRARRLGFVRVPLVPGNLYIFWGYRTLHANEPCDPERIRATALYHFADPHADSYLRKITGQAKVRATIQDEPG